MPAGELKVGQLVYSRAGRDRGRPFLIWQLAGPGRVYLVDGRLRRTSKPKLKNVLHVQAVNRVATVIADRLKRGEVVTDAEVRRAIAQLLETEQA
ncbi:RNA-binding protein [Moorella sp. ACPs]|uniref:RNA-binding protein n=1 Tax=Neomoorella carbonis TaxID=3062783 RepID=UPI003255C140